MYGIVIDVKVDLNREDEAGRMMREVIGQQSGSARATLPRLK
jgi:hypothetical protein